MKKISYYVLLCLLGMYFLLYSTPVYAVKNPTATGKPGIKGSGGGGGATGGNAGKAVYTNIRRLGIFYVGNELL